jgi:hypothetical protein
MKTIYKPTGVQSCKVTHHCTAALQYAGVLPHQINTLTNHILDKQHAAYQLQAEWEVHWTKSSFLLVFCNTRKLSHFYLDL